MIDVVAEAMLELPITLPSLKVAVVKVPAQMTEQDFKTLTTMIEAWKSALVRSPGEKPGQSPPGPTDGPDL